MYQYCWTCKTRRRHYLNLAQSVLPQCGYCTGHKERPVLLLQRWNWSGALAVAAVILLAGWIIVRMPW